MAKVSRRRSLLFDNGAMKRLTGFFGGLPTEDGRQTAPPPLPPLITNLSNQESDGLQAATPAVNGTPTNGTPTATTPASNRIFSLPIPSSPHERVPRRVESLSLLPTATGGAILHPPAPPGSLSPYLHPSSSPVTSGRGSYRNFSSASAMTATSYTSYASSRPNSSHAHVPVPPSPTMAEVPRQFKKKGRRGIFGRKRKGDVEIPAAWRLAHGSNENLEGYNFGPLTRGDPVPDLWDPNGDTLVFLAPRNTSKAKSIAPTFRINAGPLLFAALGQYIEDLQFSEGPEDSAAESHSLHIEVPSAPAPAFKQDARPGSAPATSAANVDFSGTPGILGQLAKEQETGEGFVDANIAYKVYYPATGLESRAAAPTKGKKHKHSNSDPNDDSFQRLIDVRNLFAFLNCTFLVSTLQRETPFQILEKIFKQLQGPHSPELHAEDLNVSRRISMAEGNLMHFVEELKVDDIRNDDAAIVEALIMGERWRCQRLYREGFIHASGRWEDIKGHSGLQYVSKETKKRLDRASLNLHQIRLYNVTTGLTNFDYPGVWVGDDKYPEMKPWKAGFEAMRKLTLSFYKNVFGSWPPRAGKQGKGGGYTETGGLNRVVLKRLYDDLCILYDLLVDREWIHGDRIRFEANCVSESEEGKEQRSKEEQARTFMRKIMATLDNSTVPVQPNIPFDLPRSPYIPPTPPPTANGAKKAKSKKPKSQKRLKSDQLMEVLRNSYNKDTLERAASNDFVSAYLKLEHDFANGKKLDDIIEARRGRWIFMYCVLQNLPMTVIDAVGCQYSDGVEYFLCENVKGSLPWEKSNHRASRMSGIWGVSGDLGPAVPSAGVGGDDEIDYTYRRSHCWFVAEDWRMIRNAPGADADKFEIDGELGSDEFFEYQPLDQLLPDSPKEDNLEDPIGLSPPPFRQSYPASGRTQSVEISNGGGYIPYSQKNLDRVQSLESNRSDSKGGLYREGYHPGIYYPGTYSESDYRQSYQSQQSQEGGGSTINPLPLFDFQTPKVEDTYQSPTGLNTPIQAPIPMNPREQSLLVSGRAFGTPESTDSDRSAGRQG